MTTGETSGVGQEPTPVAATTLVAAATLVTAATSVTAATLVLKTISMVGAIPTEDSPEEGAVSEGNQGLKATPIVKKAPRPMEMMALVPEAVAPRVGITLAKKD